MHTLATAGALVATGIEYSLRERYLRQTPKQLGAFMCDRLPKISMTATKLGQLASARPDIFNKDFCQSLVTLQDAVAPMPFETIREIIDVSKVSEHLGYVDPNPVASATIAQVHRGRLHNGRWVALKVLRPGILQQLTDDMDLMDQLLRIMTVFSIEGALDT